MCNFGFYHCALNLYCTVQQIDCKSLINNLLICLQLIAQAAARRVFRQRRFKTPCDHKLPTELEIFTGINVNL